jgi:putative phosphoesterase
MSKKIIIISDNHYNKTIVDKVLSYEKYDLAVFLGDSELGEGFAKTRFDYYVNGNNDFDFTQEEVFFEYQGYKFMIMHGHTQDISVSNFKKQSKVVLDKFNVNFLLYGHTHIPYQMEKPESQE